MTTLSSMNAKAREVETHNGIKRQDRSKLAEHLSVALADTALLNVKTQAFHWNVVGPLFYGLHNLTEKQYLDLTDSIDEIAERIRAIGFTAPGSLKKWLFISTLEDEEGMPTTEQMIKQLVDDNEACSRTMRLAAVEAEEVGDIKTADLLTERVGKHEENAWMLGALIS